MPEATLQQVTRNLGIDAHMLVRRRKTIENHSDSAFPCQGHARDEKMMRLKRKLARVKKKRDF